MSLASIKQEFLTLSDEEQDRLTEMFLAIRLSKDKEFVKRQGEILDQKEGWTNFEDLKDELGL